MADGTEANSAIDDKVYVQTDLDTLCAALRQDGVAAATGGELDRLRANVGYNAPVFYDMLQEGGTRLYPAEAEYPAALDRSLVELSLKVPVCELATCVERIAHRQARAEAPPFKAQYLDLARDSSMWATVASKCGPHLEILRVQRVHNEYLDDQYESFKQRMQKKPYFNGVNEQVLFHGTGRTHPNYVCLGTEGFDPRCARHGNYGCGTYFSTTPNYSAKHYAYQVPLSAQSLANTTFSEFSDLRQNAPRQMVLARVACGNVCDMHNAINQSLTRPPPMFENDPFHLFDAVRGGPFTSRSSEMCMVVTYDKAQAIPDFVVTFRYRSTFEEANRPHRAIQRQTSLTTMYQSMSLNRTALASVAAPARDFSQGALLAALPQQAAFCAAPAAPLQRGEDTRQQSPVPVSNTTLTGGAAGRARAQVCSIKRKRVKTMRAKALSEQLPDLSEERLGDGMTAGSKRRCFQAAKSARQLSSNVRSKRLVKTSSDLQAMLGEGDSAANSLDPASARNGFDNFLNRGKAILAYPSWA